MVSENTTGSQRTVHQASAEEGDERGWTGGTIRNPAITQGSQTRFEEARELAKRLSEECSNCQNQGTTVALSRKDGHYTLLRWDPKSSSTYTRVVEESELEAEKASGAVGIVIPVERLESQRPAIGSGDDVEPSHRGGEE